MAKQIALYGTTDRSVTKKQLSGDFKLPVFTLEEVNNADIILDRYEQPSMYLFNSANGGFLILSASYLEQPILAYSNEDNFDVSDMPMGLANWIHLGTIKISQLNKQGVYYSDKVPASWATLGQNVAVTDHFLEDNLGNVYTAQKNYEIIQENVQLTLQAPLITDASGQKVAWGQGNRYNALMNGTLYCNDLALVGCVPLAMAQIMYYHKSPTQIDFSSMPYRLRPTTNIDDLTNTLHGSYKLKKFLKEVSFAVVDIDISDCDVSNAYLNKATEVFKNNYNYSSDILYKNYNSSDAYSEIVENKRPVLLRGAKRSYKQISIKTKKVFGNIKINQWTYDATNKPGHVWVADGWLEQYDRVRESITLGNKTTTREYNQLRNEFIYFNWGWHKFESPIARFNGWYQYDLFDAAEEAKEGNLLISYETELALDPPNTPSSTDDSFDGDAYIYEKQMIINIKPK